MESWWWCCECCNDSLTRFADQVTRCALCDHPRCWSCLDDHGESFSIQSQGQIKSSTQCGLNDDDGGDAYEIIGNVCDKKPGARHPPGRYALSHPILQKPASIADRECYNFLVTTCRLLNCGNVTPVEIIHQGIELVAVSAIMSDAKIADEHGNTSLGLAEKAH